MSCCAGCGGQTTTGGCCNPDCGACPGGTYVNGKKTHTASGRPIVPIPGVQYIDDWPCMMYGPWVTRCRHGACKP